MKKLLKGLKALLLLIKKPSMLNLITEDENVWEKYVAKKYMLNNGLKTIPFQAIIPNDTLEIDPFSYLEGGSLPTDLALLKYLCLKHNVDNYFEIGTWRGESVANVSRVVGKCTTLNLPDEDLRKMKLSVFIKTKGSKTSLFLAKTSPGASLCLGIERTRFMFGQMRF